jgi:small subunit ribosomal protein S13
MARIVGINLPPNKKVDIGLTSIFGVGIRSSRQILKLANVPARTKCHELTDKNLTTIREILDSNYLTGGALQRAWFQNIKRLVENGSRRGRRHHDGLPVRGQRTKTNARTRKQKVRVPLKTKK